ncbi:hypothetical protein SAMN05421823_1033 [Catalinimonas alkaloidigena]|uniref:PAP2 superfamily protein n=1 Tax=Catalinimonas alkaloidigena TaxID=1075417 RepID=A0A1G9D585_9BACT|nr:hypothetical protein [Catalinimonas alkaloidigena]SDK58864.1 hypothetical protein SAMN05421823_1033 [Catalinimonas alkaloidigena]
MNFLNTPEPEIEETTAVRPYRSWAFWVSVLLHPLLMPTLLYAVLFYFAPEQMAPVSPDIYDSLLWLLFLMTCLLPAFISFTLYRTKAIRSLTLEDRTDRFLPIIFTALIYTGVTYLFQSRLRASPMLVLPIASIAITVLITALISYFWKISAHMVGICGVLGFLLGASYRFPQSDLLYPIAVVCVLAGVVGSARLALHAHTPAEVLGGSLLGVVLCALVVVLFA